MPRLFIVGGSDAGISAALRARELAPDWQLTVIPCYSRAKSDDAPPRMRDGTERQDRMTEPHTPSPTWRHSHDHHTDDPQDGSGDHARLRPHGTARHYCGPVRGGRHDAAPRGGIDLRGSDHQEMD